MKACDKCGEPTRTLHPYVMREPEPAGQVVDESRPLSRSVLRTLNPVLEAAIPWGEHPDDARGPEYGVMCAACANGEGDPAS